MQHHIGRTYTPPNIKLMKATAPNQVWMWDITYLNGPVKGMFYYLYLISDLFSRDIVVEAGQRRICGACGCELIKRTALAQKVLTTDPLVILHSDNGIPMRGATMLATCISLESTAFNQPAKKKLAMTIHMQKKSFQDP